MRKGGEDQWTIYFESRWPFNKNRAVCFVNKIEDAALIATAPDLLEFMQMMVSEVEKPGFKGFDSNTPSDEDIMNQMKALIHKATGGKKWNA